MPTPSRLPQSPQSPRRPRLTRLADLADALPRRPPSCGRSRLVAVDGHAGSGKSTFAAHLSTALGGAPVLPLDSLATHDEPFAWLDRLTRQVIEPLRGARAAHYPPYDWDTRTFRPPLTLPAAPVVLIEGVGAGRAALRPWLALLLWMDLPREEAWRRGRRRDGPALAEFWDGWSAAERRHFAADPSRPFADHLVRQCADEQARTGARTGEPAPEHLGRPARPERTGRRMPPAYEVLPGPGVAPGGKNRNSRIRPIPHAQ